MFSDRRRHFVMAIMHCHDSGACRRAEWKYTSEGDDPARKLSMTDITILSPTGTLGAGFGEEALKRGMSLKPNAVAVDAGSTDPGPYHLGSGVPLYTNRALRKQIATILKA